MRSSQSRNRFAARNGLSIIEIIVVLVCLVILAMVIVPYVQHSRESQRLIACQNRIRNLAFAIKSDADDNAGRFLPLTKNDLPWTAGIMPLLQVSDQVLIQFDEKPMDEQELITVTQLLCPNGQQYAPGKSCYVLNGGWGKFRIDDEGLVYEETLHTVNIDLDNDGEVSDEEQLLIRSSGVVWRPEPVPSSWTQSEIESHDGLSQTILLSETQNAKTWMSMETFNLAFVVGVDQITWGDAPEQFHVSTKSLGPYAMNSSRGGKEEHWPSPGSLHEKGVNVLFADGAFRTLNDNIDPLLYLRLMTPGGSAFGEVRLEQSTPQLPKYINKTDLDQPIRRDDSE